MTLPCKPRYRTTHWKQYNAALKARGSLSIWLDKRMSWFAANSGKRGRSPTFSDAAIQFCLTLKNLFGLALRQTTGLVQSVLQLCGLTWPVPDFSTLCRRQLDLNVQVPYTQPTRAAPAGGFDRDQVLGPRQVEMQKAWAWAPSSMAQAAHWH